MRRLRSARMALLVEYASGQRRRLIALGVVLTISTALQVINPQIVRFYIDSVYSGGVAGLLIVIAVGYLVSAFLAQVLMVLASYLDENAAWSMTNALRARLLGHCLDQDIEFHRGRSPGELIERVDGDVTALANFLSSGLLTILGNALLVVGVFVSMLLTDWRICLVLLGYTIAAVAVLLRVRNIATGSWKQVRQSSADLFGFLGERLTSTEDIRSANAETHVQQRLSGLTGRMLRGQRTARLRTNLVFLSMHGLYLFGYGAALAVGAYLYTRNLASIGTVYLIVSYTNSIYQPLDQMRTQIEDLQRANASIDRVIELLAVTPGIVDGPGIDLPAAAPALEFDGVTFRYARGAPDALHEVSFTVPPGGVLGVLGRTGSGKTTLSRLVARLYDPTGGTIRLNGKDIRDARLAELRARIGVVTQDVRIFNGTVRDNLVLFDDEAREDRVRAVVDKVGLADWLDRLPAGLDTVLRSGGSDLSAGEAQLLAVARVLLRDPQLIILDEASSRLDLATERQLAHAFAVLLAGRTAIVIAHRPATLARADQVLVLAEGRVVEQGAYRELAADADSRLGMLLREDRKKATL